jgi:succinate dehydrogenase / fumarate reductase flavoprotein subunit
MTRESTSLRRVCVVGTGVAGLAGALELATRGVAVDIISCAPPSRSGSALFRDGIAAALSEGDAKDSPAVHAADMALATNTKAALPVLRDMAEQAPAIVALLERMGVPFDRTPEGLLAAHPAPGSSLARSVGAGSVTGHHVVLALDEQLRRLERDLVRDARGAAIAGEPLVRRLIPFELVGLVRDDAGVVVGVVAQDLRSMTVAAFPYDAVLLATGGYEGLFADSAGPRSALGSGIAIALAEGAVLADADSTFCHPLAIAGPSKLAALPDSLRAQRARIFAAKVSAPGVDVASLPERERVYITALADLASPPAAALAVRAIADAQAKHGTVYLDLSHKKSDRALCARYADIASLCERWTAKGLFDGPLPIRPAVARTLGGLFVDHEVGADGALLASSVRSQATSIPGLYAAGGAASAPFMASAPASDLLLSDLYGGRLAAEGVIAYRSAMAKSAFDLPKSLFDGAQKREDDAYAALLDRSDENTEDARVIHAELRALLSKLAPHRDAAAVDEVASAIETLEDRASRAKSADMASYANLEVPFMRRLVRALSLAKATLASDQARAGDEHSRRVFTRLREGAVEVVRTVEYAAAGKAVSVSDRVSSGEAASDG